MSLKDKIAEIKQADIAKIDDEKIKKGKETINVIGSEKKALADRIKDLKELVAKLENSYSAAKTGIAEFKGAKEKINEIFSDYVAHVEETGAEQKISGVSEILNNKEFADEEEVKEYHKKGTKKIKGDDKTGELSDKVKETTQARTALKKALPEMKLDFRGGVKEGEEMSPRDASLLKLKNYIRELEQEELEAVRKKEAEVKAEYLPKIQEIISRNLDRMFPEGKAYSVGSLDSNFNFITDEIFEFCGDELWPETKAIAMKLIQEQYSKKGIGFRNSEMDENLEAEKMIYDVQDLRTKHENLLKLDQDRENVHNLFQYGIKSDLFNRGVNEKVLIRDGKIYPNSILESVERLKAKNPEAQEICRNVKNSLTNFLTTSKNEIAPGIFTGGQARKDMKSVKDKLDEAILKLSKSEVPENFYSHNYYEFPNALLNAKPYFRGNQLEKYSWFQALGQKTEKQWNKELAKIKVLQDAEGSNVSKINNDIYHLRSGGNVTNESGFSIPVLFINEQYYYTQITDKKEIDSFLAGISGKALSEDELKAAFEKEDEALSAKIKEYPNSAEILNRFKILVAKYDQDFRYKARLIDTKIKSKDNPNYRSDKENDSHTVKPKLFYL
ncbi:MAG: hypothetical protein ACYC40_00840 [Patescibacteria group bacterium]